MHPMLNIGIRAARAAGKVITQNVDRYDPMSIEKKQRNDFVTEVDRSLAMKMPSFNGLSIHSMARLTLYTAFLILLCPLR